MLTMSKQLQMIQTRPNCLFFLVILLCASMVEGLEHREMTEQVVLSQLVDPLTKEVNEDMAELIWHGCWLDLINLKESNEILNLCRTEETTGVDSESHSKGRSLTKEHVWKLIRSQHPQLKQTISNCMRKNNVLFHVLQEGRSNNQQARYLNSLFPGPAVPKRNLLESTSEADSESGDEIKNMEIIIAVVVTATVTLAFTALFFFFCTKIFSGSSEVGQNDDGSVHSLRDYCSADYIKKEKEREKAGNQSLKDNLSHHSKNPSLDSINSDAFHVSVDDSASLPGSSKFSAEAIDETHNGIGVLPPPPGRADGMLLLKPPPGRVIPPIPKSPANLPSVADLPPPASPPTGEPPPEYEPPAPSEAPPPGASPPPGVPAPSPAGAPPPPGVPAPAAAPSPRGAPSPAAAPPPPAKASSTTNPCSPGPLPPPMAPGAKAGPPPPPPLGGSRAPPQPPPPGAKAPRRPGGSKLPFNAASSEENPNANNPKTKLKPFFWDKVQMNPCHSMVWHQLKSGSFQFNEEVIETLFGYAACDKTNPEGKKAYSSQEGSSQFVHILDHKKAQNLSIMLKALNVTIEEVCDALQEGNELPVELLQTLLKMAPSPDEELKLRLFSGDLSQLGSAERFLKVLVDIPAAYKRLEVILFMCTIQEEVTTTNQSFETLEVACKVLRSSRLFLKLLEAVLKTGNRMNVGTFRGGAKAFKLDTLLKLADVKGTDGKTTLLHFVVQEIIRSEGVRAARQARESRTLSNISVSTEDLEDIAPALEEDYRSLGLQVVSHLSTELENVKKAAVVDADCITRTVAKLGHSLLKTKDFLEKDMKSLEEESEFHEKLKSFVQTVEVNVMGLLEEEKRIMALVKSTGDYFHGNAKKDEGLRLFVIVRDFLIILDKVCKEVGEKQKKEAKSHKKDSSTESAHSLPHQNVSSDFRSQLFPAIVEGKDDSSSEDESLTSSTSKRSSDESSSR